jgi:uncharacterized protein
MPSLINIDFFRNITLLLRPRLLIPQYELPSVLQVPAIIPGNAKGIIFDIDQTIVAYGSSEVPVETVAMVEALKKQYRLCLLSNSPRQYRPVRRLAEISKVLGIPVAHAERKKPDARAFEEALRELGTKAGETVMVGDRVMTDVLGANARGLISVLVAPIAPAADPWFMVQLPRKAERFLLALLRIFQSSSRSF